jgi:FlaA1/EpsC-like NDP-sugar epimerase
MPRDLDDPLLSRLLGRTQSLFGSDRARRQAELAQAIRGQRVLVVGAAGSIGQAFTVELARLAPKALHLVDLNENSLVELVRDLRARPIELPQDFRTASLDFASPGFLKFAKAQGPHDVFVNFSALKHVRAERDPFSLMRMIEVNVLALADYLDHPVARDLRRAFSVSTDKSVRPENLMGATKNLMEQALFAHAERLVASSARFANVAFSAGSLLEGFEHRLAKGQPLAAPTDVKRYFITHAEAGQLCLLAGFLGRTRQVFFPKLDPQADLLGFDAIARAFLAERGLAPRLCANEDEAKRLAAQGGLGREWPCHFAPSDTTGEKSVEEFFRRSDALDLATHQTIGIAQEPPSDPARLAAFRDAIGRIRAGDLWSKADLAQAIRAAVPDLAHVEMGKSLDEKM